MNLSIIVNRCKILVIYIDYREEDNSYRNNIDRRKRVNNIEGLDVIKR